MSWKFLPLHGMDSTVVKMLRRAESALIWNGTLPSGRYLVNMRGRLELPTLTIEQGWITQKDHFGLDYNGIAGDSSLCRDSLSWVDDDAYDRLDALRDRYWDDDWQPPRRGRREGRVLVLGQLLRDTAVFGFSQYDSIEDFIFDAEQTFGPKDIAFRPHPLDSKAEDWKRICKIRGIKYISPTDEPLTKVIRHFRGAFAINSTGLYESAMMGLGAVAVGECPLASHCNTEDDTERLLAALATRQFRKDTDDVIPHLEAMQEFPIRGGG
jgi:hypothetical protein